MAEFLEYTPMKLPTMTSPAWPDNTRAAIEMTPALPGTDMTAKTPKKDNKKKSKAKPATPAEDTAVPVVENPGTVEETQTQSGDSTVPTQSSGFIYRAPRLEQPHEEVIEPTRESDKGNWFSRLIAPPKDELEAANNGLRWHWALEHRFMPPGSKWNETVWQGADRENLWLKNMLKQKNGLDVGIPDAATIRAREYHRKAMLDQYNKLLSEYQKGNWDDPQRAYEDFKNEVERLKAQYAATGFDPAELRLPPPVSGGRSGFTSQSQSYKLRNQYTFANDVNKELSSWLAVDPKTGKRKIDDPRFMESKKVYLDSIYERLLKHIKESSNSMADEEKQRLQILVLPDNAMDEVIKEVKGFQAALRGIMSSSSAKDWSQNNKGKVNAVIEAMGFDPSKDKATLGNQLATLGGVIVSSLSRNDELPHNIAVDLEAAKTKFDRYMKNMMLSATVAPHIVANIGALLGNTVADEYNSQAFAMGRGKADYLGPVQDISDQIPANAMPLSELIKHSDYITPTLAQDPNGRVTTAPQGKGENNPSEPYSGKVPGVSIVR